MCYTPTSSMSSRGSTYKLGEGCECKPFQNKKFSILCFLRCEETASPFLFDDCFCEELNGVHSHCSVKNHEILNFEDFEIYNQTIPKFQPIYQCYKNEFRGHFKRFDCSISRSTSHVRDNLDVSCVYILDGLVHRHVLKVPETFLSHYRNHLVQAQNGYIPLLRDKKLKVERNNSLIPLLHDQKQEVRRNNAFTPISHDQLQEAQWHNYILPDFLLIFFCAVGCIAFVLYKKFCKRKQTLANIVQNIKKE